ncbi:HEAT repeat domain-containing protein [Thiovibrio sp. JS02]
MGSAFSSETMVAHAYVSVIFVGLVTLLMVLRIISLRIKLQLGQRHQARFREIWLPIFTEISLQTPCKNAVLPPLKPRDFLLFIHYWLGFQETHSGPGKFRLNALARRLKMQEYAHRLLQKRGIRHRLAAVVFLGHLRDRLSWPTLEKMLRHENTLLSILAARSLLEIDQDRALPLVFAELTTREDWPETRVALLLRSVLVPELLTSHLFDTLQTSSDSQAVKLLPYVAQMYNEEKNRILRILLERSRSDRLTSRLLKHIECSHELDLVRHYIGHERWHIRMQAMAALGRIGQRQDLPLLLQGLSDEQWWVRYRAAQALIRMPGMNREELRLIHDNLEDLFARSMLAQTMAEEGRSVR